MNTEVPSFIDLVSGLPYIVSFWPLFFATLGTFLGITVGAIPGLTGSMLIALTLPLTFHMDSGHAIVLLVSMYMGSVSGGLISATLLRMPGTPAAVMTTFDGYPMAKAGHPGRALGLGITASFAGGLLGWLSLVILAPPLTHLAVRFGPFEYFSMTVMALVLIAGVSGKSLWKGILSGLFGALVAMPGVDPSIGQLRLTFDRPEFVAGFGVLPVLVGLFAVSQVIKDTLEMDARAEQTTFKLDRLFLRLSDVMHHGMNTVRSSLIGIWIGILPGIGPNIASVVAYTTARNFSKKPHEFGKGSEDGIVAAEASNNAAVGGSLIPLVTLGIPGSVIDALLIGALVIHNIQPGPMMFVTNPTMVDAFVAACLVSTVLMFAMMLLLLRPLSYLMRVPKALVLPAVLVFCVTGVFAYDNSWENVWIMLTFGVVGFLMERAQIPLGPFVIGLILAPIAEAQLRSGLMLTAGDFSPIFTRPGSLFFMIVAVVSALWPFVRAMRLHRSTEE